ncbi:MAG: hypothetical protein OXB84_01780 [Halobacteriovoraceae bacterium]|nr:hypothetical protein [Halobacteriovoraceae bacterium]
MPELPEVETIRRQLKKVLPLNVKKVFTSSKKSSILINKEFSPCGHKIIKINRKGKMLCFVFDKENYILSSLGMSGAWIVSNNKITEKHVHIQLECQGKEKTYLAYKDPRRFGKMHFVKKEHALSILNRLGMDVTSSRFNARYLLHLFKKHPNALIKPFLLQQKYFSGIGNYMACEICARAKILPQRRLKSLNPQDASLLKKACDSVLQKSIQRKGLTFSGGYRDTTNSPGEGLQDMVVFYQKSCGLCQGPVSKTILQGRGTYHCPKCQR